MSSYETEYSFLAPTWKLPPVAPSPMYTVTNSPSALKLVPNEPSWNNTMQNSRYVPPNSNRETRSQPTNQYPGGRSMQSGPPPPPPQYRNNEYPNNNFDSNEQYDNRGLNYPHPTQKRVQIIDHNRRTPSADNMSERESHNSHSPEPNQNQNQHKPDLTHRNVQRPNNFNVHDYLYGLSAPNPGSYVNAYKNQRRRLQDDNVNHKSVLNEYKTFVQNGGFGPAFGNVDYRRYEEKVDTEKKRKSYSKVVREINQYKVEEHKRIQNNGGQQRNRTTGTVIPRHRRPDAMRSHFLSAQEVREFEQRIKREHAANCKCSLHTNPQNSSA